jgi:hypothetical protein
MSAHVLVAGVLFRTRAARPEDRQDIRHRNSGFAAMTENTVANLEHRFQKGQSGNPAGKPKGARHKTTLLAERLMQDDVEKIVNAVVADAINGDMTAAKIILDRIAPVRRSRAFALPAVTCEADKAKAHEAVLDAVANGDLMPGEIRDVCRLIDRVATIRLVLAQQAPA